MHPLFIRVSPHKEKKSEIVISISAKVVPKAVARNRIRRVIREIIRRDLPPLIEGYRIVVMVKSAVLPHRQELQQNLLVLLKKSGMLSQ